MIRIEHLSVSYGEVPALKDLSFTVAPGEFLLVTGPSGGGKSTLGRVLTGLIPQVFPGAVSGRVEVAGVNPLTEPLPSLSPRVGVVFQNPSSQLFHLKVEDEVAFGPRNLGLPEDEVRSRLEWALEATGLTGLRHAQPAALSGGQKQRVAIAAAIAMQPGVLVLDEPLASLDNAGTERVLQTLRSLRQDLGMTIILIEHRLVEAARFASRVLLLVDGCLAADGPVDQVLGDRHTLEKLGMRRWNPLRGEWALPRSWHELLVPNGKPPVGVSPLIELSGVSAGYRRSQIIHDLSLALYPGEFTALVGPNGAGKSTLGLVMAGLLKPSKGTVRFRGGRRPRPGQDISLLFQNPLDQLFTESVDEEVAFGPRNYRQFDPELHQQTLVNADLAGLRWRKPMALSVGQQQRTTLAACLSLRPALIVLDEPTLGQDWGHLQQLMDFFLALNRQGTTILLISHDYKLIHHYARRVVLLEQGRIRLDGRLKRNDHNPFPRSQNRERVRKGD